MGCWNDQPAAVHWTERWTQTGPSPNYGANDCAAFAAAVLKESFGLSIDLPAAAASAAKRQAQIEVLAQCHAVPTISPRDGDGVLMTPAGSGRLRRHYHIGVYADTPAGPCVLHLMENGYPVLTRLDSLEAVGKKLEGYYRWIAQQHP